MDFGFRKFQQHLGQSSGKPKRNRNLQTGCIFFRQSMCCGACSTSNISMCCGWPDQTSRSTTYMNVIDLDQGAASTNEITARGDSCFAQCPNFTNISIAEEVELIRALARVAASRQLLSIYAPFDAIL